MRRGGVMFWRRVRQRERLLSATPLASQGFGHIDYDRNDIMDKIDSMTMGWRLLINEHGFQPVMQARFYSTDIRVVESMMSQRREQRQQQLANARY